MDPTLGGTAPGRRGPTWVPIAAAGALFVIVIGLIVGLDWGRGSDTRIFGLTCPRAYRAPAPTAWVPANPQSVDGIGRLAPVAPPAVVVICAYRPPASAAASARLFGHKGIGGDLTQVSGMLAWVPRRVAGTSGSCAGTPDNTSDYLIGLSYAKGSAWVSVPAGGCAGNGRFQAAADLGAYAGGAYQAGHWVAAPPGSPAPDPATCTPAGVGRLGAESRMVPRGAIAADVCATAGQKVEAHAHGSAADTSALAAALNAAPITVARPGPASCTGASSGYRVVFHYPTGTDVAVSVAGAGCSPLVDNGLVSSLGAAKARPVLAHLLAGK